MSRTYLNLVLFYGLVLLKTHVVCQLTSNCLLPQQPYDGKYSVLEVTDFRSSVILKYECNPGYSLKGSMLIQCNSNGTWTDTTTCIKKCPGLQSETTELSCRTRGVKVSCEQAMESGSEVTVNCKHNHFSMDSMTMVIRCVNGVWNKRIPDCTQDCGEESGRGMGMSMGGSFGKHGDFPWHVAIYSSGINTEQVDLICGGSILNREYVITAAHCFWDENQNQLNPNSRFEVAAGKLYREYRHISENQAVQKTKILDIRIPAVYGGTIQRYQSDIALVKVKTPFNLSPYVYPVCLDLSDSSFDERQTADGMIGKTAGWGLTETDKPADKLMVLNIPVVNYLECKKKMPQGFASLLTHDKICAGYTNGSALCLGDSGGGLVFSKMVKNRVKWFLRGIVSVGVPSEDVSILCRKDTYSGFTRVFAHADWISKELQRYNKIDYCDQLIGTTVTIKCIHNNAEVSCNERIIHGTVAVATCLPFYVKKKSLKMTLVCNNGVWDSSIPTCIPECGKNIDYSVTLKKGGVTVIGKKSPWNVAIYQSFKSISNLRCGGTILTANIVISAADCFWNEVTSKLKPVDSFTIQVGNLYMDYNDVDYSNGVVQKSKIKEIKIPTEFSGSINRFNFDIAMVILKSSLRFSESVQPICLDLTNIFLHIIQTSGRRPVKWSGWRRHPGEIEMTYLHDINVAALDYEHCRKKWWSDSRQHLTTDKFCGELQRDTIWTADAGSGLVVKQTELAMDRWYLRGVVSVGSQSQESSSLSGETIALFTHVYVHKYWIAKILSEYS